VDELNQLKKALASDEEKLQFGAFSNADALAVGLALVRLATARGKPVAVVIYRNGALLFAHSMDGCSADNGEWLARKCRVVERYGHSSWYMGVAYRARGTTFEAHTGLDPGQYAAKGGAFPLLLKGTGMVGVVAVSGLSEQEDHALVVCALEELRARS
jgi:uncharacterized protein (UPF0303 family)